MTTYELKQETEWFRLGYWDGYSDQGNWSHNLKSPVERVEYLHGWRQGTDDNYRDQGCRRR